MRHDIILTIRREQIAALENARRHDFERRVFAYIQRRAIREGLLASDAWLRHQISRGVREARAFGLQSEKQIVSFVEVTCMLLGGFPEGPLPKPALAILLAYGVDADIKLDRYHRWAQRSRYGGVD